MRRIRLEEAIKVWGEKRVEILPHGDWRLKPKLGKKGVARVIKPRGPIPVSRLREMKLKEREDEIQDWWNTLSQAVLE